LAILSSDTTPRLCLVRVSNLRIMLALIAKIPASSLIKIKNSLLAALPCARILKTSSLTLFVGFRAERLKDAHGVNSIYDFFSPLRSSHSFHRVASHPAQSESVVIREVVVDTTNCFLAACSMLVAVL
jgi:hypothetical protein